MLPHPLTETRLPPTLAHTSALCVVDMAAAPSISIPVTMAIPQTAVTPNLVNRFIAIPFSTWIPSKATATGPRRGVGPPESVARRCHTRAMTQRDVALETYRYLRGGMPVMIVMLTAAVLFERIRADCWQTSISAYYFTSAHAVFIASVCATGAMFIVYRGSTDTEDALLNLAGVLAFVVAMVPTTRPVLECGTALAPGELELGAVVRANMWAVVIALALSRVASWWLHRRTRTSTPMSPLGRVATWIQRLIFAAGLATLIFAPDWFTANAHGIAAMLMFAAMIVTVFITAFLSGRQDDAKCPNRAVYHRLYHAIAVAMVLTLAVTVTLHRTLDGFNHAVLIAEAALIAEFGAYWLIQTIELWRAGTRDELMSPEACTQQRLLQAL